MSVPSFLVPERGIVRTVLPSASVTRATEPDVPCTFTVVVLPELGRAISVCLKRRLLPIMPVAELEVIAVADSACLSDIEVKVVPRASTAFWTFCIDSSDENWAIWAAICELSWGDSGSW